MPDKVIDAQIGDSLLYLKLSCELAIERSDYIPALERQRWADPRESEVSLVYQLSSRAARMVTQRNSVLRGKKGRERE